jgi:hypothetical protein
MLSSDVVVGIVILMAVIVVVKVLESPSPASSAKVT